MFVSLTLARSWDAPDRLLSNGTHSSASHSQRLLFPPLHFLYRCEQISRIRDFKLRRDGRLFPQKRLNSPFTFVRNWILAIALYKPLWRLGYFTRIYQGGRANFWQGLLRESTAEYSNWVLHGIFYDSQAILCWFQKNESDHHTKTVMIVCCSFLASTKPNAVTKIFRNRVDGGGYKSNGFSESLPWEAPGESR